MAATGDRRDRDKNLMDVVLIRYLWQDLHRSKHGNTMKGSPLLRGIVIQKADHAIFQVRIVKYFSEHFFACPSRTDNKDIFLPAGAASEQ